jgi:hypothetical protein
MRSAQVFSFGLQMQFLSLLKVYEQHNSSFARIYHYLVQKIYGQMAGCTHMLGDMVGNG